MVLDIDQFGRDTSKNNTPSLNEEKSKKILDSLAEIKNHVENKNYNPNFDEPSPKIKISIPQENVGGIDSYNAANSLAIAAYHYKINTF